MSEARSSNRRLVVLAISPWSERAKWALDHHKLAYEKIYHAPFIGERRLRKLVGNTKQRATVPVLITDSQTLTESWDIALYADREGSGTKLIPEAQHTAVRTWNDLADATMAAGRGLVSIAMLDNDAAVDESLPPEVPKFMRPLMRPVGRYGFAWFARKYGLRREDLPSYEAKMRSTLLTLRGALAKGSLYLVGEFSYADIVMATSLQGVLPVDNRYIRLGPGTRQAWTHKALAQEFSDLLEWRDKIYAQHRTAT